MHTFLSSVLNFAVLASVASSPCELPSLTEVGAQYLVFGADCRQYAYGYNAGSSAKVELKDATGNVVGAYQYIDANNVTQKVNYTANDLDGFLVSASNLPTPVQDTPQVAQVKKAQAEMVALALSTEEPNNLSQDLVREIGSSGQNEQILFKPILSVWYPVSSFSHDHGFVQHGEFVTPKQNVSRE